MEPELKVRIASLEARLEDDVRNLHMKMKRHRRELADRLAVLEKQLAEAPPNGASGGAK